MLSFSFYLLKVIICTGVLFGYYWFFLRNKIFHSYNRFYLLAIVAISLVLPVMKINIWHKANEPQTGVIKMLQVVNSSDEYMDEIIVYSHYNHISKEQVFSFLYIIVCAVFFFMLVQVLIKIRNLLKNNSSTFIENVYFIKTNARGTPFSFLRFIFWNDAIDIETKSGRQVFRHEVAHVQERHSYDKLFINILLIFFWCNPFLWFIRKELNMIHEFIADKKAVEDGDTADFAAMILQATYPQYRFPLANNFFYSPIKRRLIMLTKQNKTKVNYISRLLVLPLAVIVFAAFTLKAKTYSNSAGAFTLQEKTLTVMIDAGHGGTDKGVSAGADIFEKDISLAFAKKIKELNHSVKFKIILTRETDIYQSPQQKVILAKNAGADLFISIHTDGAPGSEKNMRTGMSVFVSKDEYGNSEASKLLASAVITSFQKNYGLSVTPNLQQREHGIWVLQANTCPAILIEAGYLTNPKDQKYLRTDVAVETFAGNVLKAIESYSAYKDQTPDTKSINIDVDVKNTNADYLKSEAYKTKALIIADSKEIGNFGYSYVVKNLERYNSVVVYDPSKAIKIYGKKGEYGVIEILTRKDAPNYKAILSRIENDIYADASQIVNVPGSNLVKIESAVYSNYVPDPLYIVNGYQIARQEAMKIIPDMITDARILTPKTAVSTYGDKGKNGVIIINTKKESISKGALVIVDDVVFGGKTLSSVMAEMDMQAIDSITFWEKDEAVKKYGVKATDGAIVEKTKKVNSNEPTISFPGITGNKISISELKNIKEIKCDVAGYSIIGATVYFSGTGYPFVVQTNLFGESLEQIEQYFKKIVPGTIVTFDNVLAQRKDGSKIEIKGRSFSFYGNEGDVTIDGDKIFIKVETEPDFPGGKDGWQAYLRKNLDATTPIDEGWKAGTYRIIVQFIVDKDGNVSDVKSDDYPNSKTAKQCIDLIRNGPKWLSAKQNGKIVKAYKKQPITFVVSEQ